MKSVSKYDKLLKDSGLNQKALSEELGITERTFREWRTGRAEPTNARTKASLAATFIKYGKSRTPQSTGTEEAAANPTTEAVPDFDPAQLKRARKASGLTTPAFAQKLSITTMSQYYRYEKGHQARKRTIRKTLFDACQSGGVVGEPVTETIPQPRARLRTIVSEDLIKDRVERFERTELANYDRDIVSRALRFAAQEQGMVPRELREAMVTVIATVQGRVPLHSIYTLLTGIDT